MHLLPESPEFFSAGLLIFSFLGLITGSFASALVYRIPRGLPWFRMTGELKRSFCPECRTVLGLRDLVPLFSFIFSRGKCRHCGKPVSLRYPLVELVSMLASAAAFLSLGLTAEAFIVSALIPFLVALAFIDFEEMILPDQLVAISALLVGILLIFRVASGAENYMYLVTRLFAAVIYGVASWTLGALTGKIVGRSALGFGDVKFFAVAGLGLGVHALPAFMILSGGLGIALALIWRLVTAEKVFPFGPALIAAFYLLMVFT